MPIGTPAYYASPTVLLGATDISSVVSSATVTAGYDELEITAFGNTGHRMTKGLKTAEVSLSCFATYGVGSLEATLNDILGDGNTTVTISNDEVEWEITNMMLSSAPVINQTTGEISTIDVTLTGGEWTRTAL